jgi:hypothetical protein
MGGEPSDLVSDLILRFALCFAALAVATYGWFVWLPAQSTKWSVHPSWWISGRIFAGLWGAYLLFLVGAIARAVRRPTNRSK